MPTIWGEGEAGDGPITDLVTKTHAAMAMRGPSTRPTIATIAKNVVKAVTCTTEGKSKANPTNKRCFVVMVQAK